MKIEIYNQNWNTDFVSKNKDKIFVFGDNDLRIGKKGQSIIRDLPNAIGIRTKKIPSLKSSSFYTDLEYDSNKNKILSDILKVKMLLLDGKNIVLSKGGYGTGLSDMKNTAPKTFEYLCDCLKFYLNFDNENGTKYFKIPSNIELVNAKYIELDYYNKEIILPVNNSFFISDYLSKGINSIYDLIRNDKKIAFTSNITYKNDDILIFYFRNKDKYLICKVYDSYILNDMPYEQWSIFEGLDISFISNIELDKTILYQTHFKFISTLDSDGKMIFKDDIFGMNVNESELIKPNDLKDDINSEILLTLKKLESLLEQNSNSDIKDMINKITKK